MAKLKLTTVAHLQECIDGEAEDAAASDMALSVCWVDATTLLASYGSGKLVMWKLNEQGDATALWVKAKAHDYEAWSVTYSPDGTSSIILSIITMKL